jgi:hypothetical protein
MGHARQIVGLEPDVSGRHASRVRITVLRSVAAYQVRSALIATSVAVAVTGIMLPFTSIGSMLGFTPLPWTYWPALALILLGYAALAHLMKSWFVRRFGLD